MIDADRFPVSMTELGTSSALAGIRPDLGQNARQTGGFGFSTLFFARELRNYLEAFGFQSAIALVLRSLVATTS
jgi:hypothetical protein